MITALAALWITMTDSAAATFISKIVNDHARETLRLHRMEEDLAARKAAQEPEWGFKSIRWRPPMAWGSYEVSLPTSEGHTFSPKLGVPYEILYFPVTGALVKRFRIALHGWNEDDIDTSKIKDEIK